MSFERARRIADAILYEGYVLYPYRASSRKNRYRWTFGVVAPRTWSEAGGCEPSSMTLECLVEARGPTLPRIEGRLRFLHVERREVEAAIGEGRFRAVESLTVGAQEHITWEEANERELPFTIDVPCERTRVLDERLEESRQERTLHDGDGALVGRVVRTQRALALTLTASAALTASTGHELWKLTIALENVTPFEDFAALREDAVVSSLVGAHLVLSVSDGAFVSLLDPPAEARAAAESCRNVGLFPVLAGEPGAKGLLLASPIVLYDHPQIAAESPGDTFDGTEIDELLALSTRSLTDDEKREARATDRRAAEVIDRAERLSDSALLALHGKGGGGKTNASGQADTIGQGSRVRVRLGVATGTRRTDAQDMFLDGRIGIVEEVREDLDGQTHLAVILDDDPAAELHRWYGRHLHFRPEELELVEAVS
ncbi:MAG: hypothetical protein JWN44_4557 [Myxococcales bacterium]|nr:hypothetical protein [Myxococcales bacterium]